MNIANIEEIKSQISSETDDSDPLAEQKPKKNTYGAQYEVVSRIAYLIGVDWKYFENEDRPFKIEIFKDLEDIAPDLSRFVVEFPYAEIYISHVSFQFDDASISLISYYVNRFCMYF